LTISSQRSSPQRLLRLAEEVRDVQLPGRAALDADRGAVEVHALGHAQRLAHEKALAVVEDNRAEVEAELERPVDRLRDAGEKDVELSGLKRRQALLRRRGGEVHLLGIVEDGDGQGAPEIDEEALPLAVAVGSEEAG
jgi:hypothetical protein